MDFSLYSHALVAVAGAALIILAQNLHIGVTRGRHGLPPDAAIPQDYGDPVFRIFRVYANSVEATPAFAAAVFAAILAGASPFWVNLSASLYLVLRLAYWWVYLSGVGNPQAGLRTFVYVPSWALNIVIAVLAIWASLT